MVYRAFPTRQATSLRYDRCFPLDQRQNGFKGQTRSFERDRVQSLKSFRDITPAKEAFKYSLEHRRPLEAARRGISPKAIVGTWTGWDGQELLFIASNNVAEITLSWGGIVSETPAVRSPFETSMDRKLHRVSTYRKRSLSFQW